MLVFFTFGRMKSGREEAKINEEYKTYYALAESDI
jgi:hypothetical protein